MTSMDTDQITAARCIDLLAAVVEQAQKDATGADLRGYAPARRPIYQAAALNFLRWARDELAPIGETAARGGLQL